ncbi:hypothetical protein F441_14684 [Phytophthora nicotianae CJ01A1]|nr:hypothetical protein F443_14829 [Phytophthora nicotianae P1569]ETL86427.1 hypothetical protein L917_14139 [Phytophthora nicotianae]ETP09450.1 hypothetical protein F441_14684 [Phytophthora nicotianae CJ01A1]ETP27767.1 hypothetical protein F442_22952 [Phytophthora nicotianae P10297]
MRILVSVVVILCASNPTVNTTTSQSHTISEISDRVSSSALRLG